MFRVIIVAIVTVSVMNNGLKGRTLDYERDGQDVAIIGRNPHYGTICIPDYVCSIQNERRCTGHSFFNRFSHYADWPFRRNSFSDLIFLA